MFIRYIIYVAAVLGGRRARIKKKKKDHDGRAECSDRQEAISSSHAASNGSSNGRAPPAECCNWTDVFFATALMAYIGGRWGRRGMWRWKILDITTVSPGRIGGCGAEFPRKESCIHCRRAAVLARGEGGARSTAVEHCSVRGSLKAQPCLEAFRSAQEKEGRHTCYCFFKWRLLAQPGSAWR